MDQQQFDLTLRDALMEALRRDWQAVTASAENCPQSLGQRRRLSKMLEDPRGYYVRYTRADRQKEGGLSLADLRHYKKRAVRLTAAVVAAVVLAGSALAESITGGRFFQQMFQRMAVSANWNLGQTDIEQLPELGGGNVGAILDTDALRFEVMDAVSSGYTAMIAVRVTAKELDRIAESEDRYYEFSDIGGSLMTPGEFTGGVNVRRTDEFGELAPNQFFILLTITKQEPIPAGTYTVTFRDLAYVDDAAHTSTVTYPGEWLLEVELKDGSSHSRSLEFDRPYVIDGVTYTLEQAQLSPLSIRLYFRCDEETDVWPEPLFELFWERAITLKDGTVLDSSWSVCGCGGTGDGEHNVSQIDLELNAPLPVEELHSIRFGDQEIVLD